MNNVIRNLYFVLSWVLFNLLSSYSDSKTIIYVVSYVLVGWLRKLFSSSLLCFSLTHFSPSHCRKSVVWNVVNYAGAGQAGTLAVYQQSVYYVIANIWFPHRSSDTFLLLPLPLLAVLQLWFCCVMKISVFSCPTVTEPFTLQWSKYDHNMDFPIFFTNLHSPLQLPLSVWSRDSISLDDNSALSW